MNLTDIPGPFLFRKLTWSLVACLEWNTPPSALLDSSELLAADGSGTAVGDEKDDPHYIGWVFRNAAREAGVLADSYESACVIMHVSRAGRGSHDCALRSPLWNDGVNHVVVNFGDTGRSDGGVVWWREEVYLCLVVGSQ